VTPDPVMSHGHRPKALEGPVLGMRIRRLIGPAPGYLGPRTLAAFLSVLALGIVLYLTGLITSETTLKGVGFLFSFVGVVGGVAILLRWLIYREIG